MMDRDENIKAYLSQMRPQYAKWLGDGAERDVCAEVGVDGCQ